jgi:hypothetical protein
MLKFCVVAAVMVGMAMPAFAARKMVGTAKLRDSEPVGMPNKKHKQHQAYDLSFVAAGNAYTCRTDAGKSMNATDFVVGSVMTYEIDRQKAKLRTAQGKKVQCVIVRVEAVEPRRPPEPQ